MADLLRLRPGEVIIDLFIVIGLMIGVGVVKFGLQPTQNGYSCDDLSIRLEFHPSTVPSYVAYIVGTLIVIVCIVLSELHNTTSTVSAEGRSLTTKERAAYVAVHMYRYVGFYAFGVGVTTVVTDIGKLMVGRLRPNFLDVCQPPQSQVDECANNPLQYITEIQCEGDLDAVHESRLSFPSGHSSFVFFAAVYALLYLQARCRWRPLGARLVVPLVQLLCVVLALAVAFSRISDHKHHWTDVLAGSLLGTVVAFLVATYTARFFSVRWQAPQNTVHSAMEMTKGDYSDHRRNGVERGNVV